MGQGFREGGDESGRRERSGDWEGDMRGDLFCLVWTFGGDDTPFSSSSLVWMIYRDMRRDLWKTVLPAK